MANKFRGEVDVEIGGRTYAVAMTLDALARGASALGVETLEEFEQKLKSLPIGATHGLIKALLAGNGHVVDDADIARAHFMQLQLFLVQLYNARPGQPEDRVGGEADSHPPMAPAA